MDDDIADDKAQKDIRDIKRCLVAESSFRHTSVYVVAVSNNDDSNNTVFIPCTGRPITCEAYDAVRDGFVVLGIESFLLGHIPASYSVSMPDCDWDVDVPLPMSVIKRYLTEEQKNKFTLWKLKFHKDEFRFETIQIISVY